MPPVSLAVKRRLKKHPNSRKFSTIFNAPSAVSQQWPNSIEPALLRSARDAQERAFDRKSLLLPNQQMIRCEMKNVDEVTLHWEICTVRFTLRGLHGELVEGAASKAGKNLLDNIRSILLVDCYSDEYLR